jgi:hypothetical protein
VSPLPSTAAQPGGAVYLGAPALSSVPASPQRSNSGRMGGLGYDEQSCTVPRGPGSPRGGGGGRVQAPGSPQHPSAPLPPPPAAVPEAMAVAEGSLDAAARKGRRALFMEPLHGGKGAVPQERRR